MNCLVFYDTQFGNTEQIARAIATEFEAIGPVQIQNARHEVLSLPQELALLVVGGPTQMHHISSSLRAQLDTIEKHRLDGVPAATFDTRARGPRFLTGAASGGIAKQLKRKGAKVVVEPASFLVEGTQGPLIEGELERARAWARNVVAKLAPQAASVVPAYTGPADG